MSGHFFETYVVSEIIKYYMNYDKSLNEIYYYRDFQQKEIDMLINEGISITPIKNFELLNKFNKIINHRLIICMIDEIKSYYRRSYYILIELIYINDWFFKDKYSFITKYKE